MPLSECERQKLDEQFETLLNHYCAYAEKADVTGIRRAYEVALEAHADQKRVTGEPYMVHPLAVTDILTELEVDAQTIQAALLHDTVEDTVVTPEALEQLFGREVSGLVEGVTKLAKMSFSSSEELQAENFRKMFLAMAQDIRVVMIKLADRLHNMRTMKSMRPDKQMRIAQETLDIYAPLAHRLGIYKWKWELEDLCLRYLDRTAYYELVGSISQRRDEREAYLEQVIVDMHKGILQMGIKAEIEGRPKHFYSIYRKMQTKGKVLDQIYDLFACRVIVQTVADCYAVLGLVHEMFRPMPGRFKDYIAMPKPNMYQSLHTTVLGPKGIPFEVQIRTFAMHRTAEFGVAAHYRYKESGDSKPVGAKEEAADNKLSWLRQLLDWQKDMKDAGEFMETLKSGLLEDEVFIFTPRGDVISLPAGATSIDFAYNIHSGIGNRMYGAKINGRIAPLTHELHNGDIVEVLTSDKIHGPSRDWLKIAKSSSARSKINQWFKKEMREENIVRGKEALEREIKKSGFTYNQLMKDAYLEPLLRKHTFNSELDLLAGIGYGALSATKVFPKLRDEYIKSLSEEERTKLGYRIGKNGQLVYTPGTHLPVTQEGLLAPPVVPKKTKRGKNDLGIIVKGIDNCLVHLSHCCHPVPGDAIIGYISRGKGVTIHRKDCPNVRKLLSDVSLNPSEIERASRLIECHWSSEEMSASYQVHLKITAHDRQHLLGEISMAIAEEKATILSGQIHAVKDVTATVDLVVEISSPNQYGRVLGRIKAIRDVIEVRRV